MATDTFLPVDRDAIQSLAQANNEPAWLTELRLEALELAGKLELPKLEKARLERWNIDAYGTYKSVKKVDALADLPAVVHELLGEEPQELIVQQNSGVIFAQMSQDLASQGVIFTDLATAVREHEDLVRKHLMSVVRKDENQVTAIHAALWSGGVFVYVPKNVVIDRPLQAVFLSDDADALFVPHVLIVAESNSSVTYVDNVISNGISKPHVHNSVIEVVALAGAKVQVATVSNMNRETTGLTYRRAAVGADAQVEWIVGEMNHGDTMSDTNSLLQGNGSSSDMKVVSVGTQDQKLNVTTRAVHIGRSSTSEMLTRAVMRDEATGIFNGITKIEKGATNANGEQTERVLMLSPTARGDANPLLLIDEDEVKAGHAASVGQVNKEHVYYLMSRGISKEDATNLIIYGFLAPIVNEIPIAKVKQQLSEVVERKLGQR